MDARVLKSGVVSLAALGATLASCSLLAPLDDSAYGALGPDAATSDATTADGGASAAFSCAASTAEFCDDFERSAPLGAWSGTPTNGGATLAIVDGGATHGGVVELTGCPTGTTCAAALVKNFTTAPVHLAYAFDLEIVEPPNGTINFSGLTLSRQDGRTPQVYLLIVGAGKVTLAQQVNMPDGSDDRFSDTPLAHPFPVGSWVHVALDVDLGTPPTATVNVDVEQVARATLLGDFVAAPFQLMAGNFYSADASGLVIRMDDVTLDSTP